MSRLSSKLLELLGGFRLFGGDPKPQAFKVGDAASLDSLGSPEWRAFLDPERLYNTWAPHESGVWMPFHCATLFAAADTRQKLFGKPNEIGPAAPVGVPAWLSHDAMLPDWLTSEVWTIVDLPGPMSVAAGVLLAGVGGAQPVCTFDNWPSMAGAIKVEFTLAALLFYASRMQTLRQNILPTAPPVWLCDRDRFAAPRPSPGQYDNRYFLDDRLIPGVNLLRASGVRRIVYLTPARTDPIIADLGRHFVEFEKQGFELLHAALDDGDALHAPGPLALDALPKFNAAALHFMRSSAGGFGGFIPHPSSGG